MKKEGSLNTVLIGILYFVLGLMFFTATDELLKTFNYILVCICSIIGILQMIGFFLGKKYKNGNYTDLLVGVVFIWVSLILYVYYGFMINILPILFSLYLFIMAISLMIKYVEMKDIVGIQRNKYVILSLIAILIGCLLVFNPGGVIFTYLKVTGVYLILVSFMYFMDLFKRNHED